MLASPATHTTSRLLVCNKSLLLNKLCATARAQRAVLSIVPEQLLFLWQRNANKTKHVFSARRFYHSSPFVYSTTTTANALANGSYPVTPKDKVCIIGSGNWGSAIAKIIGSNTPQLPFCDDHVNMWVHEEEIGREKLSHIINHTHENVKYLPGITLPENVAAVPDLRQACDQATLLIFVVPHQFLPPVLPAVRDCVEDGAARGISLIKGLGT